MRRGEGCSELVRSFDPAGEETVFFPRVTIWQSSNVLQMCHGATRNDVTRNASGQRKQRWPANGPLAARKSWPLGSAVPLGVASAGEPTRSPYQFVPCPNA